LGKIAHDIDPANEKKKARSAASGTFEAVAKEYLEVQKTELRARSYVEVERHLTGSPCTAGRSPA
jgi:hypothetical protein